MTQTTSSPTNQPPHVVNVTEEVNKRKEAEDVVSYNSTIKAQPTKSISSTSEEEGGHEMDMDATSPGEAFEQEDPQKVLLLVSLKQLKTFITKQRPLRLPLILNSRMWRLSHMLKGCLTYFVYQNNSSVHQHSFLRRTDNTEEDKSHGLHEDGAKQQR